jgi:hypothetical protein
LSGNLRGQAIASNILKRIKKEACGTNSFYCGLDICSHLIRQTCPPPISENMGPLRQSPIQALQIANKSPP